MPPTFQLLLNILFGQIITRIRRNWQLVQLYRLQLPSMGICRSIELNVSLLHSRCAKPDNQRLYDQKSFTCSVINSKFLQFKLISYQNLTPFMKSFRRDLRFVTCLRLLQGLSLLFPSISYKITDNNRYSAFHFFLFKYEKEKSSIDSNSGYYSSCVTMIK